MKTNEAIVRKMLEISLAVNKHNLDAFRTASRGMNQAMTFRMSTVVKKVLKSHKGQHRITLEFINLLENIGSFQRDKIPISTMRRMTQKNYITHAMYANPADTANKPLSDISLRKSDYRKHAELKVYLIQPGYVQTICR